MSDSLRKFIDEQIASIPAVLDMRVVDYFATGTLLVEQESSVIANCGDKTVYEVIQDQLEGRTTIGEGFDFLANIQRLPTNLFFAIQLIAQEIIFEDT